MSNVTRHLEVSQYGGKLDKFNMKIKKLKATLVLAISLLVASCAPDPVFADVRKYEQVHVNRVVDGDTADLSVDLGFGMTLNDRFRLYGIDTPEKNQAGNKEATATLKTLIEGKDVVIEYYKQDKYGRRLATIYVIKDGQTVDVNDYMVKNGYAKSYFGGKKE